VDLTLTPEQELIRASAREFAERELAPHARDWDRDETMDRAVVAKLAEAGFLTNVRHQGLVRDSLSALQAATDAVAARVPHEMLLMDLYNALRPLDAITGATTTDDILNLIFSTFCIGK